MKAARMRQLVAAGNSKPCTRSAVLHNPRSCQISAHHIGRFPRHVVSCIRAFRHATARRVCCRSVPAHAAAGCSDASAVPPWLSEEPTFSNRPGLYDPDGRLRLKNLTIQELEAWCVSRGEKPARALQLWRWMYADDNGWVRSMQETVGQQNGLSQKFVDRFRDVITLEGGLERQQVVTAQDGTRKIVFKLVGGEGNGGTIEAVLIPVVRQQGTRPRITLCVSSQVGCAMNCQFCFTGRMGLLANLSAAHIVEQVVEAKRVLKEVGEKATLTNIVFMGMGEPLHNLPAVLPSISIMEHPLGLHLSKNKITVSTVGLLEEMRQLAASSEAQIALSLHAATDEIRDWIVPVNRRHPLTEIRSTLLELFPAGPRSSKRVLVEYVMLRGINDTPQDAQGLVEIIEGVACKVNLITFNPHQGTRFQPSLPEDVTAFRDVLIKAGRVCTIRSSRGDDEMAACGQLGNQAISLRPPPILEPPPRFRALMAS